MRGKDERSEYESTIIFKGFRVSILNEDNYKKSYNLNGKDELSEYEPANMG